MLHCPLPYRVAPVFVQVVSPPLGWSLLSSFVVEWSPSDNTRGPSEVFETVDVPCSGPLHFPTLLIMSMTAMCPHSDPDVGHPFYVRDIEHTYFDVWYIATLNAGNIVRG